MTPCFLFRGVLLSVVVLSCCCFVGLLRCFGLLYCFGASLFNSLQIAPNDPQLSQMVPKDSQKARQRLLKDSQKAPKRIPRGPSDTKNDLGRSRVAPGGFCSRFFGALGPIWVPFWDPVGSRENPKIQLLGPSRRKRDQKMESQRGIEKMLAK